MRALMNKQPIKNKKDGFILLELVVVLVIIIIMLVILIPLITSYIDSAKEKAELSEARAVKVAIQTSIIDDYFDEDIDEFIKLIDHNNYGLTEAGKKEVERLLHTDIGKADNLIIDEEGYLNEFTYITVNGSKIIYDNGSYKTVYIY